MGRMKTLQRILVSVTAGGVLAGTALTGGTALAAPAPEGAPDLAAATVEEDSPAVITDVQLASWNDNDIHNHMRIEFEVADPNPKHHYTLRTRSEDPDWSGAEWWGENGTDIEVDTEASSPTYGQGTYMFNIDLWGHYGELQPGAVHTFWIEAYNRDPHAGGKLLWSGAPSDHQMPEAVAHPSGMQVVGKFDKSGADWDWQWKMIVGETYTIRGTSGEWEEGTTFDYNVWLEGRKKSRMLIERERAAEPLTSFTVKPAHQNKGIHINLFGNKPGLVTHSYGWMYGVAGKPLPKAWVKSYGKKKGQARVKKTVRVTKPVFSKAGKKQNLKVTYQWRSGGKVIKGAKKNTFKIKKKQRNKKLTVKVSVTKKGHKTRSKTFTFGKVKK